MESGNQLIVDRIEPLIAMSGKQETDTYVCDPWYPVPQYPNRIAYFFLLAASSTFELFKVGCSVIRLVVVRKELWLGKRKSLQADSISQ